MANPGALLKAILILPFNVLGTIPVVIVWQSGIGTWPFPSAAIAIAVGLLVLIGAIYGMVRTSSLFLTKGEGTPAPWDPPQKLVVEGPYRHVRNPMLSSVIFGLIGEGLVLNSSPILIWAAAFFLLHFIYLRFSEEPGLVKRFGEEYEEYRRNVPQWIPRIKPWNPMSD